MTNRPFAKLAPIKSAPKIKCPGQIGPQEKNTLVKSAPWKLLYSQREYVKQMIKITI